MAYYDYFPSVPNVSGIYGIYFRDELLYIGISNNIHRRWNEHAKSIARAQRKWDEKTPRKYIILGQLRTFVGKGCFSFHLLYECDRDKAAELEPEYIAKYGYPALNTQYVPEEFGTIDDRFARTQAFTVLEAEKNRLKF